MNKSQNNSETGNWFSFCLNREIVLFTFFGGSLWHFLDTRDSCLSLQCLLASTELNIVFLSVFLQQPSAGQRIFFFGVTFAPASTGLQVSLLLLTLLSFLSYSPFLSHIYMLLKWQFTQKWSFCDHLIWKVTVLYCMIYGITLVCSTTYVSTQSLYLYSKAIFPLHNLSSLCIYIFLNHLPTYLLCYCFGVSI